MNKQELIEAMAKDTGLSKKDAAAALNSFTSIVAKQLKKKEKVQLTGFATFETVKRSARTGRNPQTGEEMKIKAATVAKCKMSKTILN